MIFDIHLKRVLMFLVDLSQNTFEIKRRRKIYIYFCGDLNEFLKMAAKAIYTIICGAFQRTRL